MKITNVQIYPIAGNTSLKGFAQVTLDNALKITGLKLFEGDDGLFIAYPRNPKSKKNLCFAFPTDPELRREIELKVITAFCE